MLPFQLFIACGLIDDLFQQGFQFRTFPVVCRCHIADPFVPHHFRYLLPALLRIIYPDGMAAVHIHQLHTGDIRIAVSDINHIPEGNPKLLRREPGIYIIIIDIQHALLYTEQELGLIGIIDHLGGPDGLTAVIIEEGIFRVNESSFFIISL